MWSTKLLYLYLCIGPHFLYVVGYNATLIGNLETALTSGYKKHVRPTDVTDVAISAGVFHINQLDIVAQRFELAGFVLSEWMDKRLKWDPTDYDGIIQTKLAVGDVWIPPLVINNAANGIAILSDDDGMEGNYVSVLADGTVIWLTAANIVSQCSVDIQFYPFDKQQCHVTMTSWSFDGSEVNIFASSTKLFLDLYEPNGEWELTETALVNYTRNISIVLPGVRFTFYLTRKYSYYVLNMIIPFIILALLGTFVFVLPVESGEKLGFALTILLSMSVVMSTVSEAIPPISTNTCKLSVYVLTMFIISAVETLVTVITCQTNERHEKGFFPGSILQRITRIFAKMSFYRRPHKPEAITDCDSAENNAATLPKKKEAWVLSEKESVNNGTMYTFQECAFIFDRVNFLIFIVIKVALTIPFFVALQVDGANQTFQ